VAQLPRLPRTGRGAQRGRPVALRAGWPRDQRRGRVQLLGRAGGAWRCLDGRSLEPFIENPRATAPGTTMNYNGMRSVQDRMNLIAYISTFGS
jgi:hypothetical protein